MIKTWLIHAGKNKSYPAPTKVNRTLDFNHSSSSGHWTSLNMERLNGKTMKGLKRIMVGLDFTTIDQHLIQYTAFLAYYLKPEKIYFVNIQPDLDIPDSVRAAFPELRQPRDEKLLQDLKAKVKKWFPDQDAYEVDFQIIEGSARVELARWAHIKNVDLLLLGRKSMQHGKGIVPQQLARKLDCSILFIPENVRFQLKSILIANDFSPYAKSAIQVASQFQSIDKDIKLYSGHVFSLPQGYYRTGKSEEEFTAIMRHHAEERSQKFLSDCESSGEITPLYCFDKDHRSAARVIHETATEKNMDLIVIGSRGHTPASAFLLGSVSEKLIRINDTNPILMVKHAEHIKLIEVVESL
ncbi:MAG: universal stress protein [Bacteroidia bacterium]